MISGCVEDSEGVEESASIVICISLESKYLVTVDVHCELGVHSSPLFIQEIK